MSRPRMRFVVAGALLLGGCGALAGVDFDKVHPLLIDTQSEAGGDGPNSPPSETDGAHDAGLPTLGDGSREASSCTPDPNSVTCKGHCGDVIDNCGATRKCSTDCGQGNTCQGGVCTCSPRSDWCTNRCGSTTDNCSSPLDCGGCDGGLTCTNSACGCVPADVATTCAGSSCGTAVNNCNQPVGCGDNGACANPSALCMVDGSCCLDNGAACVNRCGNVVLTNNCNQQVGCPQDCSSGQVCVGTTCCSPEPAATTCAGKACGSATNNCGQVVVCPDTCVSPNSCGGGGAGPNACGCTPDDPCGTSCGTVNNRCGTPVACSNDCDERCRCAGGTCTTGHYCKCFPGPCN